MTDSTFQRGLLTSSESRTAFQDSRNQDGRNTVPQPKTVLLVDADNLVRFAIKQLIDSLEIFEVVAEASNLQEALSQLEKNKPDLLISEFALPGASGLELLHEIQRRQLKGVIPVILSQVSSPDAVRQALLAGAQGYILKSGTFDELATGLTTCLSNKRYIPSQIAELAQIPHNAYELGGSDSPEVHDPLQGLSPREREIFHLLASGLQNTIIAKKLFISPRTVETHRARIVRKLGITSNGELIRFAIKHGLTVV